MNHLLEVEDLELQLDCFRVLKGVNLRAERDEIVALLGENGAGKTMTLRSIVGLEKIDRGTVKFKGEEIQKLPAHSRVKLGLSYCPSEENVFPRMSVRENLEMGKYLFPDEVEEGLDRALQLFPDLAEFLDRLATELSGGEKRMLALGKSLMTEPELLLLDEFSLGLSQEVALEFSAKVKEVNRTGISVLFVEQNRALAADLAGREYRMVEGRITEGFGTGS
ncbi:MAG: ABC transporter ATP-binding protein [Candidatus Acetothermia bacterium]